MGLSGIWLSALSVALFSVSALYPTSASSSPVETTKETPYTGQSMVDFFPEIKGDLTAITWVHAVNSIALLTEALHGSAMMLEADVVLGTTEGSKEEIPVMAHPPANTSNLALQDFLRDVIRHNLGNSTRKGIKLDFKSIDAFEKSVATMKESFAGVPQFPVWLNADILQGPVNSTTVPVDSTRFLSRSVAEWPNVTLSLGWTTRWGAQLNGSKPTAEESQYQEAHIKEMEKTINSSKVRQPVTYAVRAGLAAHSLENLEELLKKTPGNATLTIWSSQDDDVDVKVLRNAILTIGKNRVYVDVPEKLMKELDLPSSATTSLASAVFVVLAAMFGMYGLVL